MGLRRVSVVIAAAVPLAFAACGGPLDSPDPPPVRDAGVEVRLDAPLDRPPSGAGGARGRDAGRDLDSGPDGVDGGGGDQGGWPVVPECVSGLPPEPQLTSVADGGVVVIGCTLISLPVARIADTSHHGLIFSASLDDPLPGISVTSAGVLCGDATDAPIEVGIYPTPELNGGNQFATVLRVRIEGPGAPLFHLARLNLVVASTNFTLDREVVDFGMVPLGTLQSVTLTAINALDSAPFWSLYAAPNSSDPFSFSRPPVMPGPLVALQPGSSAPLLTVTVNANRIGTYQSTFTVSPFLPGIPIDPSCGVIRSLTVRAQVILPPRVPPP